MPLLVGTRRALLGTAPAAPALVTFASDTFTDTATTLLQSHTASDAGTWTKHASSSGNAEISNANRVRNSNAATFGIYYHSATPPSADYDVSADLIVLSDNDLVLSGVAGRIVTGTNSLYGARYNCNTNLWELFKVVAGANTNLGTSATPVPVANQSYALTLRMRGTALSLLVDGATIASATDSSLAAAGKAGIRTSQQSTDTTGISLDNFRAAA